MLVFDETEREMTEFDQCAARLFAEAILQVGRDGIRHEERAIEFEKRGPLNGLHVAPKMAVFAAQVAVPAAAGPGFELHGHGLFGGGVEWTKLFEESCEGLIDGRPHVNFFLNAHRQVFDGDFSVWHDLFVSPFFRVFASNYRSESFSARSFTFAS